MPSHVPELKARPSFPPADRSRVASVLSLIYSLTHLAIVANGLYSYFSTALFKDIFADMNSLALSDILTGIFYFLKLFWVIFVFGSFIPIIDGTIYQTLLSIFLFPPFILISVLCLSFTFHYETFAVVVAIGGVLLSLFLLIIGIGTSACIPLAVYSASVIIIIKHPKSRSNAIVYS